VPSKILAILIGLTLSALLSWWLIDRESEKSSPAITLLDGREALFEFQKSQMGKSSSDGARRGELGHRILNERVADVVFNITKRGLIYDPLAYFKRPPFTRLKFKLKEHPAGVWHLNTNSLGLREDRELSPTQPDLRMFVTGDSHTDGVCENFESYPHLLEDSIKAANPERTVEVLNGGVGGYSFYNYIGAFDLYKEYQMDAYIVGVYGGNDFLGVIGPHLYFQGKPIPQPIRDKAQVGAAKKINASALSQGFFALSHFASKPGDEALALHAASEVTLALAERCKQAGVRLVIVYIPPVYDVLPDFESDETSKLREIFDLDDDEMKVTERQANAYLSSIREVDIDVVDMRPSFKAATEELYWRHDHHINLAGHRLIAEAIKPLFVK
jgi:lysophospholipase L1-like esterase